MIKLVFEEKVLNVISAYDVKNGEKKRFGEK
jgi:hypothetical protein